MLWNDEICKYVSLLFTGSHKHVWHLSKVAYGEKSMTLLQDRGIAYVRLRGSNDSLLESPHENVFC